MANKAAWECAHRLCCIVRNNNDLFGGIPFIGLGDFHQVAPVVDGCGETAALAASVKSSPLWSSLRISHLTTPMRSINDVEYTAFVDDIGDDTSHQRRELPLLRKTTNMNEAVDFLFPPECLTDAYYCLTTTFLSPHHIYVDEFNDIILEHLAGEKSEKNCSLTHKLPLMCSSQRCITAAILSKRWTT